MGAALGLAQAHLGRPAEIDPLPFRLPHRPSDLVTGGGAVGVAFIRFLASGESCVLPSCCPHQGLSGGCCLDMGRS